MWIYISPYFTNICFFLSQDYKFLSLFIIIRVQNQCECPLMWYKRALVWQVKNSKVNPHNKKYMNLPTTCLTKGNVIWSSFLTQVSISCNWVQLLVTKIHSPWKSDVLVGTLLLRLNFTTIWKAHIHEVITDSFIVPNQCYGKRITPSTCSCN